jgi:uroporphyrinogen-III synthase
METNVQHTGAMDLPLRGATVGVTADRRSGEQSLLLERLGAKVLHAPTIHTLPLVDEGDGGELAQLTEALALDPPVAVVLTTGIGVRGWLSAVDASGTRDRLDRVFAGADLWVRGPKAAGELTVAGHEIFASAASELGAELVARVAARYPAGSRVAVQIDGSADPVLVTALAEAGLDSVAVRVYRWTDHPDLERAGRLIETIVEQRVDAVTFTSSPALTRLVDLADRSGLGPPLRAAFHEEVAAAVVGPACAATARRVGIVPAVEPDRARLGAMVEAVAQHLARPRLLDVAGERLALRRAAVVVGDRVVELPARERSVLEVLAARPGAVVSRRTLGQRAWPDGWADDHTVGVTVTRLRRRLGRLGSAVETSPRRGYRLVATALGADVSA